MKQIILSVASLVLVGTILIGCGNTQQASAPAPAPTEQPKSPETAAEAPKVEKATYVGSDTCKSCHADIVKDFAMTKHTQAFKPLSEFPTTTPLGEIIIFDQDNKEKAVSTKIDLSKAKVYGVMMNDYIIAQVPKEAGFKGDIYRIAQLHKTGEKYEILPAKEDDMDKDGKKDWAAAGFTCGECHAPGITVGSEDYGVSCETCHGPGSSHVSGDKTGTMNVSNDSCLTCHPTAPAKDASGNFSTQNHYGTRNFFASAHVANGLDNCLTCHTTHKANANGKLLNQDSPKDICVNCHQGKNYDPAVLMWKNPYDAHGHITVDHSFGAFKYEDLGDDPNTKNTIEIKNQKLIDIIKQAFPKL